ncbi:MAG: hypothetical protein IPG79_18070 [Saprospiraceae bacterium]|nr:hypothetical protein [Saprospiraceae bacterium]
MERKLFLIILLTLKLTQSFGQYYQVESFQDEYKEIEKYTSLLIEKDGFRSWDKRFDLKFYISFFDIYYDYINGFDVGICYFDDEIDYSLRFTGFWL